MLALQQLSMLTLGLSSLKAPTPPPTWPVLCGKHSITLREAVMNNPLRIISLGWGVQSWTLAAMAALGELPPVDYAIHADTTHEHEKTYIHAAKWTPWLEDRGVKVMTVRGKPERTSVVNVYGTGTKSVMIPAFTTDRQTGSRGQVLRQCTHDWKIMPIRAAIRRILADEGIKRGPGGVQSIQGISLDEWQRMRDSDVKYIKNVYPLVDLRITRAGCVAWLESHGLDVPPKSSCVFCPYKSIASWKTLKRVGGDDWDHAEAVDVNIRDKRPKAALYVHPGRKPLAESISIPEDFGAEQMEFEMPCDSGHCFT